MVWVYSALMARLGARSARELDANKAKVQPFGALRRCRSWSIQRYACQWLMRTLFAGGSAAKSVSCSRPKPEAKLIRQLCATRQRTCFGQPSRLALGMPFQKRMHLDKPG